jgi:hypothetical protein
MWTDSISLSRKSKNSLPLLLIPECPRSTSGVAGREGAKIEEMSRVVVVSLLAVLLVPALLLSQYGRRTRFPTAGNVPGTDLPAVTFQGNLRALTKKDLTIDVKDATDQSLTFRISHKTKFIKDGKEIKRNAVEVGTVVAVDATRDPDQKFSAVNVIVNPPKPKTADQ